MHTTALWNCTKVKMKTGRFVTEFRIHAYMSRTNKDNFRIKYFCRNQRYIFLNGATG